MSACLAALAFRKLRRAIAARSGSRLRPDTRLDEILPRRGRAELWEAIEDEAGLRLPPLVRPAWLTALAATAALGLGAAFGWAALLTASVLAWASLLRFAVCLPRGCEDLRGLARQVTAHNFRRLSREAGGHSRRELVEAVILRVSGHTGLR